MLPDASDEIIESVTVFILSKITSHSFFSSDTLVGSGSSLLQTKPKGKQAKSQTSASVELRRIITCGGD